MVCALLPTLYRKLSVTDFGIRVTFDTWDDDDTVCLEVSVLYTFAEFRRASSPLEGEGVVIDKGRDNFLGDLCWGVK